MIEKTETEIMKNWNFYDDPVVSILCTSYNHENYIEEAIDGFLMQETDFPFEIIIHDDASTDNTANKIKPYAEKYPNIIKTILQKENQYSQGKKVFFFMLEKAKGKYHAICEGDDYWIDSKKLQIQIDLMEQNPECYMSFHAAEERFDHDKYGKIVAQQAKRNKIFSTSEIILGEGGFCPTASIVLRREVVSNLPSFFHDAPIGDYFLQIFGSLHGGALYIDKVMSVYRIGVVGSWSHSMKNIDKRIKYYNSIIKTLDILENFLDEKYNKQYHLEISKVISQKHYSFALTCFNLNMFEEFKKSMELSYKSYALGSFIYLVYYRLRSFPLLINFLRKFYHSKNTDTQDATGKT